jgi:hypothetical protein
MRKDYSIRLRVPEHIGSQLHALALKESRSDSAMISLLVTEALSARRSVERHTAEVMKLAATLRGDADAA